MSLKSTEEPQSSFYFTCTRTPESLLEQYQEVRSFSEQLCKPLETEDYVVQSMEDVSPTKWHLAHTSWFFETFVLAGQDVAYQPVSPEYGYLFNSYYVKAGKRYSRPRRGLITRPGVQEVFEYRQRIDEQIITLLQEMNQPALGELLPLIEIGINHEQQHQELMMSDIKHVFSFNPLYPVYRETEARSSQDVPEITWVSFEEGIHRIGHEGNGFCFDSEMPCHRHFLENFQLADRLVTNGEYIQFIEDGGYREPTLWLSEGWYTVEELGWKAPLYWREIDGEWHYFTLDGLRKVDPAEPVCHLSYYEADAFARWAGARLPSEAEWETASTGVRLQGNFVGSEKYHPAPVQAQEPNGLPLQMFGDTWEWTQSPYIGYPGYKPLEGALGEYNGKFMCNQMVLRGGSCVTSQSHIRKTYRNFFPA
jgi:ergothioneine biosynthesis protein EgtB